ncbi:Hypothetical_protein [Hexamita inflata]|uniref:Hypothetical_protein n=1 Tax=Hexamita inflata TaxID=28002 RepID=A0AA86UN90_9EUKA|nr:Hypothetical protein HINF_LOCUS45631 [Hexamita inflata]
MMLLYKSTMNYLGNIKHQARFLLCQRRPINQSQGQENEFYLGKSLQKTKFVQSRYLEQIIIYCINTDYHELYQLNILRMNTNYMITVRLIVRFWMVQKYQIFLFNNQMNVRSNDQQNARQVISRTQ